MRWQQGRATLEGMIARGEFERVPASRAHADLLLSQAHQHVKSARAVEASDPPGAYQLLYDAARKALGAVLENQGLGPPAAAATSPSSTPCPPSSTLHLGQSCAPSTASVAAAIRLSIPPRTNPASAPGEVQRDLPKVQEIVDIATKVLDEMSPF